jgi:hypothetical protein
MAKNTYPLTTLLPVQKLDFRLSNGMKVRTVLMPRPNAASTKIAHVEIDYAGPGSEIFNPIGHEGIPRTVLEAASLAYQIAQSQTCRGEGFSIVEVLLEGEEFVERADMEKILGTAIPVKLV